MVLHHLLQWIALNFTQCEEKARNVLGGSTNSEGMGQNGTDYLDQPERHPDYWDAVSLFLLQGRTEQVTCLNWNKCFWNGILCRNMSYLEEPNENIVKAPIYINRDFISYNLFARLVTYCICILIWIRIHLHPLTNYWERCQCTGNWLEKYFNCGGGNQNGIIISHSFVFLLHLMKVSLMFSVCSGSATQSIADFEFRWRHWQTEVRARIDEGDFAADSKLSAIAGVLSGSESAYTVSKAIISRELKWKLAY